MTRTYTKMTVMAVLYFIIISSCKKEAPAIQKEKTKTDLISEKSWKLTKVEYNRESSGGAFIIPDGPFNSPPPSYNVYLFTADHKYSETDPDGVAEEGTWKFNSDETSITMVVSRHGNEPQTTTGTFTITSDKLTILLQGEFYERDDTGGFVEYKQKRLTFTH